jgi:UTP:GlnB (protein PII) uridylyltransferase
MSARFSDGDGDHRQKPADLPAAFLEAFQASMPATYQAQHSPAEVLEHAHIVWNRRDKLAHVESCVGDERGGTWICVVTDDRPGLLSLLSAAISAHSLDILAANIYGRTRRGRADEAVDLFMVQPLKGIAQLDSGDVAAIGLSIVSLLMGETDVSFLEKRAQPTTRPMGTPPPEVYFDDATGEADFLIVDADDRPGLLSSITSVLYREGVGILLSEVMTVAGRARDGFRVVDLSGSRLSPSQKSHIIKRVAEAVGRTV